MTDTLSLWHPSQDAVLPAGYLHWGAVPRRSGADLSLRVCNNSAVYTATAVELSIADTGTVASPSQAATHLFSTDGIRFTATAAVGDLAPGSVSAPITLRRVTPADADLGDFTFDIVATPTSWT